MGNKLPQSAELLIQALDNNVERGWSKNNSFDPNGTSFILVGTRKVNSSTAYFVMRWEVQSAENSLANVEPLISPKVFFVVNGRHEAELEFQSVRDLINFVASDNLALDAVMRGIS